MKLSKLIAALQQAERDLGGDVDVEVYNGFEYIAPPIEEGECYPVNDVVTLGMRSYMKTISNKNNETKVYIKFRD